MQLVKIDNTKMVLASLQRIGNQDLMGQPIRSTMSIERAVQLAFDLFSRDRQQFEYANERLALMIDSFPKSVGEYIASIRAVKAREITNMINSYNEKLYAILMLQKNFDKGDFHLKTVDEILTASASFLDESKSLMCQEHEELLYGFISIKRVHDQIQCQMPVIQERALTLNEAGLKLTAIQSVCQVYHQMASEQLTQLQPTQDDYTEQRSYLIMVADTAEHVLQLIHPAYKRIVEVMAWFGAMAENQKIAKEIIQTHEKHLVVTNAHAVC